MHYNPESEVVLYCSCGEVGAMCHFVQNRFYQERSFPVAAAVVFVIIY